MNETIPSNPPAKADRPQRYRRITAFLGAATVLSTTALLPAIETKLPPYRAE
jgi:hypothetical protein